MGTNLGDLEANLLAAAGWIEDLPGIDLVGISPVYRTEPLGPALHPFLNCAALVGTDIGPEDLLRGLKDCERKAGRMDPHVKWGPRVLDLDVLLMGDRVRGKRAPLVPHPALLERDFALRPLLDLVPDARHPATGARLAEALGSVARTTILSGPHPLPAEVSYSVLEHTADAGLEVTAPGPDRLLESAVMALADAVVPRAMLRERERIEISLEAGDMETLLVQLLMEAIFLLDTRGFLPSRARARLEAGAAGPRLAASLFGCRIEPSWVRLPVKAATHHDLLVERDAGTGWRARVYLDV